MATTVTIKRGDTKGLFVDSLAINGLPVDLTGILGIVFSLRRQGKPLLAIEQAAVVAWPAGFPVVGVNQGTKTFTVTGDAHTVSGTLSIVGSSGNNGVYTVVSAVFAAGQTNIVVLQAIPSSTADGYVGNQVQYQPVAGDVAMDGTYDQEWEVTFPSNQVLTFPNDSFNTVVIQRDLGPVP